MQDTASKDVARIETVFGTYAAAARGRLELTYDYETAAIFAFRRILAEIGAEHMLDVGANIGVYSIFCSGLSGLRRIDAFEPAPQAYELLATNVALQPEPRRFALHKVAASAAPGKVSFRIVSPLSGANAVVEGGGEGEGLVTVEAAPVDSLVPLSGSPSGRRVGIKVDVEGHEAAALSGMRGILTGNECFLQVESLRQERGDAIERLLAECGYAYLFSLRDDHLFLHRRLMEAHSGPILRILAGTLAADLRDLMSLRREKRTISLAARKLRELASYRQDPLQLPEGANPFA